MKRWLVAAIVAFAAPAHGSTILHLDHAQLEAGADRIIEGTVVSRVTRWNATHTGLETHAWMSANASLVEVVVPGGELDGARHIVIGMPAVAVGETARWFLRERGDGTYRVYGWAQGKWPARTVDGITRFEPAPTIAEHDTTTAAFSTNGMVWPAATIPVQYRIQNAGSADLTNQQLTAAIDAAFATWAAVPCASLSFQNAGTTDLGVATDGTNVMLFIESGWTYGSEAAAATALWIIDGQQTADIAVNGENFTWAIGPPGSGVNNDVLDLQAVMTHEIGHFSGLGHTMRAYDTMYYSWSPWTGQRTLSIDDKLGLCSLYPTTGSECPCPSGETCTPYSGSMLCEGTPDPIGTPCNYDRIECDGFCLFTATNLSSGYCSTFCETHADCPATHHCDDASAGSMMVRVCFEGPRPDACATDDDCPTLQHCDVAAGVCTFECRNSEDCGAGYTCDGRGTCVYLGDDGGGCGCHSGNAAGILGMLGLLVVGRRRRP